MTRTTRILLAIEQGDTQAVDRLLPVVYDELRKLAAAKLIHEKPGQTLDATALVHEAYLRLVGSDKKLGALTQPRSPAVAQFTNRGHFFAAAAEAMRRILVDNARRKKSLKRGGAGQRVPLVDAAAPDADDRLLALDEALKRLAAEDALAARVVELHHFAGLNHEQVAQTLGTTVYQARQKWTFARAWLKSALADS